VQSYSSFIGIPSVDILPEESEFKSIQIDTDIIKFTFTALFS